MRKKRKLWYWLLVRIPFWFVVLSIALVFLFKWVPVRYTPLMLKRSIQNAKTANYDTRRHWKPLEEISPEMVKAVIISEDSMFDVHHGFDWDQMRTMWKDYREKGKELRGCSTISQQTAKNVFTFGTHTWVRKGLEGYWTILIEAIWGKRRIMEVYLNVIETGPGLYGVEAAARKYYHCHAAALDRFQAAYIAVCLPRPLVYSPVNPSNYIQRRQRTVRLRIKRMPDPEWL